jgi:CelD/BcsL family acetyltransferase involved in cellulose biosynthesis
MTRSQTDLQVEPHEALEPLQGDWTAVAERSGNLFATWEWNSLWWECFGRGRRLLVAACRDDTGAVAGLLPAYVARGGGPFRLVRLLGHGPGDRLGPVCDPADRPRVARALRAALGSRPWRGGILLAEDAPAEAGWSSLLAGHTVRRVASPRLDTDAGDWEAFMAGLSRSFRKSLRRHTRLADKAGMRCRLVERPEDLDPALDALFALHRKRWGADASAAFAGVEEFQRAFAAVAFERGWLRLWLLEEGERPVAAAQCFRFGGADWYYQAGRDPECDAIAIGTVVLARAIRDCLESGGRRFEFLRGDDAYKRHFATGDPGVETFAVGAGRVGRGAVRASAAVPTGARRAVVGRLGP